MPKWFIHLQKLFGAALGPLWCGPKKFLPHPPQKGNFRAAEISAQSISTIFGQKNVFGHFFGKVEGRSLGC